MSSKLKDLIKKTIKEYLEANDITVKDDIRGKIREQISDFLGEVIEIHEQVKEQISALV
ncbi:lysine--tRNA ligase, partial [Francisella tularensis subsp. holarctica]|nr:lysine--tRNA ligase [Francisella tularensis subsp. holarctica]